MGCSSGRKKRTGVKHGEGNVDERANANNPMSARLQLAELVLLADGVETTPSIRGPDAGVRPQTRESQLQVRLLEAGRPLELGRGKDALADQTCAYAWTIIDEIGSPHAARACARHVLVVGRSAIVSSDEKSCRIKAACPHKMHSTASSNFWFVHPHRRG